MTREASVDETVIMSLALALVLMILKKKGKVHLTTLSPKLGDTLIENLHILGLEVIMSVLVLAKKQVLSIQLAQEGPAALAWTVRGLLTTIL